ncbi:MAG: LysM peptidoglycan-binding domain-containing protein, partial [Bellilinea sp.]
MIKNLFFTSILILLLILPFQPVLAQSSTELPVYIVQPGDTLNLIAVRFGISVNDLLNANSLENPDILNIGTALKIPGLEGFSGTLTTDVAGLGATLTGLSRQYQFPIDLLVKLNRITSPAEIFIGSTLVLPSLEESLELSPISPLDEGESLFEKAVSNGLN